jgi:hypothetical protein
MGYRFSRINITLRFSKVVDRFDTSRPDQSTDVVGSATVFASMRYLGLGTLIELTYDGASDLKLTYQNGGTGTAGGKQWWRVRAEPSDMEAYGNATRIHTHGSIKVFQELLQATISWIGSAPSTPTNLLSSPP